MNLKKHISPATIIMVAPGRAETNSKKKNSKLKTKSNRQDAKYAKKNLSLVTRHGF
jgi:hypothetical protein